MRYNLITDDTLLLPNFYTVFPQINAWGIYLIFDFKGGAFIRRGHLKEGDFYLKN